MSTLSPTDFLDLESLLDDGQRQIRTAVARWIDERVLPIIAQAFDDHRFPSELVPEIAEKLHADLRSRSIPSFYDAAGSIGRRYRRQDEIGTPLCVTVDFDSLEDQAVTVRDRDTMEQVRVQAAELGTLLAERISSWRPGR